MEARFAAELSTLRKGSGLGRPNVLDRVGPLLRQACSITQAASHVDARIALTATLEAACAALTPELGFAARAMLGIHPDYRDATLTARQVRLAVAWSVDPVTVRRRCDLALRLLSVQLAATTSAGVLLPDDPFHGSEWYTVDSSADLRLDLAAPEMIRSFTIAALRDGLDGVDLGLEIPKLPSAAAPDGFDVEVRGGSLDGAKRVLAKYFVHRVRFPHALAKGETHTFSVVTRSRQRRLMVRRWVSFTRRRVDRMEVRVRFDRAHLPTSVWRADGIPQGHADSDRPPGELLRPDRFDEVVVEFDKLVPGLGYGLVWTPRLPG